MVDISPLNDYVDKNNSFIENFVESEVKTIGIDNCLTYQFRRLNCANLYPNGIRAIQTIDYSYKVNITETLFLIQNYIEDEKERDEYLTKLLKLHQSNIEYEKTNPPIVYRKSIAKTNKTKTKTEKIKTSKSKTKETNKVSVAEKKLAAKVAKLNNVTFKIKPIK